MRDKKVNMARTDKDQDPCPRCGHTKRWLPRGTFDFQYLNKCTKCGYKWKL